MTEVAASPLRLTEWTACGGCAAKWGASALGGQPLYLEGRLTVDQGVPAALEALCFDPETAGGLLAAVDPSVVDELAAVGFALIGAVVDGADRVRLLP